MRTFTVTDPMLEVLETWDKNHNCNIEHSGAIGGRLTFCFTPTSLGEIVRVKCACGEECVLNDFSDW